MLRDSSWEEVRPTLSVPSKWEFHERPIYPEHRIKLWEWINGPLSDYNKFYRLNALSQAFGLRRDTIEGYISEPIKNSIGLHLVREMLLWCWQYPELSHNNPYFESSIFADMNLD